MAIFALILQVQTGQAVASNPLPASGKNSSQGLSSVDVADSGSDVRTLNEAAAKMVGQGLAEMDSWHDQPAISKFTQAIETTDKILKGSPDDSDALRSKATALFNLGQMHRKMCRYSAAGTSYNGALAAWDEALRHSNGNSDCLTGKVNTINKLVRMQVILGQYSAAKTTVDQTLKICQDTLVKAPVSAVIRNRQAETLIEYALLLTILGQYKEAEADFNQALNLSNQVLQENRDNLDARYDRDVANLELGKLHKELSKFETALSCFNKVIEDCRTTQEGTPENNAFLVKAADAYLQKAFVQESMESLEASVATCAEALRICDLVLQSEAGRGNLEALHQKTFVLNIIGNHQIMREERRAASKTSKTILDICDHILPDLPESIGLVDDKGLALILRGRLAMLANRDVEAESAFQQALDAFDQALKIAPGDYSLKLRKVSALSYLAQVHRKMSHFAEAKKDRDQVMNVCTEAVSRLPGNLDILIEQADEYRIEARLCDLRLNDYGSQKYTDRAMAVYDRIFSIAPVCVKALKGKGCVLKDSPVVHEGNNKESEAVLKKAIDCFDRAIKICPGDSSAYSYRGSALKTLGEKQLATPGESGQNTLKLAIASCKKAIQLNPSQKPACERTIESAETLLEERGSQTSGFRLRLQQWTGNPKAEEAIRRMRMDMDAHASDKSSDTSKPKENLDSK